MKMLAVDIANRNPLRLNIPGRKRAAKSILNYDEQQKSQIWHIYHRVTYLLRKAAGCDAHIVNAFYLGKTDGGMAKLGHLVESREQDLRRPGE
jgi:hypothetical protein